MTPIAVVAGDFVRTGGMDVANFQLARYLAGAAEEVHLVAHRVDPALTASAHVRWHRVPKPLGSYLLGEPLLARAGRRLGRALAARGGRQVVNGGNCVSGDTNWVHYVHAAYRPEIATSRTPSAIQKLIYMRHVGDERAALRAARLVIANSHATARDVVQHAGVDAQRVHVVYYGTDAGWHRVPTDAERRAAREALGWRDDLPSVAFVGALGDRRKGFDLVFDAWTALSAEATWNARLVVVGAGAELDAWKARAESSALRDRIGFLGFTPDVRSVLWACDAIVAPARYEAYGLAVHEAVCCGLPAIVARGSGVAERLPGLTALQPARPNDAGALRDALRCWYGDRERWSRAAAEASASLRAWGWDDMARRIVQLMQEGA